MNQYMYRNSFGLSAFVRENVTTYQYTSNDGPMQDRLP